MEFLAIVFAFVTCLLCCLQLRYRSTVSRGKKILPPGPAGWPFVGNLFQIILQKREFMHVIGDLRAKYGGIFTLQMGQRTLVIVTSSDLIHEALVEKSPIFNSRPPDSPIRLLFSVGKCAINSAQYGPLWRTLRRNFVTQLINPTRIRQCSWIRKWAFEEQMKILESVNSHHGFVSVMSTCRVTMCCILICLCLGARFSKEKIKNIENILTDVMIISMPKLPDFMPVLLPLFRHQYASAKELRKRQIECMVPLIRARKAFLESHEDNNIKGGSEEEEEDLEMVSPPGAAYVDSLYNLEPQGRGKLSEEELVTLVSEIIIGGTDTSATAIEWALFHLVTNQEIQEKLYNEIIGKVGLNGVVQESDVENMEYLSAVVKETFRRRPPTHFTLSHAATHTTELGGYVIPKDVNVEFYTAWLTAHPDVWEDPEEFRPERFLNGGDGENVDITGMKGVKKMFPFGVGRRNCPAWTLGVLHINMMIARMIHAFKWVPAPGNPPDPTETFVFTVVMKYPLKATLLPRNKS